MTIQEFKELEKSAEEEIKMPDTLREVIEKNNYLPTLINKYQKLYANQTYIVKSLEIDAAVKYGELVKFYKFQDSYSWGNAKEIDSQIKSTYSLKKNFSNYDIEMAQKLFSEIFIKLKLSNIIIKVNCLITLT